MAAAQKTPGVALHLGDLPAAEPRAAFTARSGNTNAAPGALRVTRKYWMVDLNL
jgi:hypothetical protein